METIQPVTFTYDEIMLCVASEQIRDREVALIGTGLPMLAATLAKQVHAPRAVMIYESGLVDTNPVEVPVSVADPRIMFGTTTFSSLYKTLGLLQRGVVDVGFLGGAEVDQFGNLNATAIGQYEHPKIRLPGSGGANDIASMANRVVILMKHEKRRFPSKVGYITSPGFLEGGNSRKEAGLKGGGPAVLISNLAVMDFEPVSHRMRVQSIHPGITREQVQDATGFDLLWAEDLTTTPEPTQFQLDIIRRLDPNGIFLKGE